MVDVYVMRHSHVNYGPGVTIAEDNPLTRLGWRLAARLAERSIGWDLQHLFVSTMPRAMQTAEEVLSANPGLPMTAMAGLRETSLADMGDYPGAPPSRDLRDWDVDQFLFASQRLLERVEAAWAAIEGVVREGGLERVGIVAHGGSINMLLRLFQGYQSADLTRCWFELDWTGLSVLRYGEGDPPRAILRVNDTQHVEALREEIAAFGG